MQVHSGSFWPQEFWKTSFFYTTAIFHKSPLTLLPVLWWGEVRRDGAPVRFEEHTSFSLKRNFFFLVSNFLFRISGGRLSEFGFQYEIGIVL